MSDHGDGVYDSHLVASMIRRSVRFAVSSGIVAVMAMLVLARRLELPLLAEAVIGVVAALGALKIVTGRINYVLVSIANRAYWGLIPDKLEPGDVILSTTSGARSRLIKEQLRSQFSHAALAMPGGLVVEAVWPRIRQVLVEEHIFTTDPRQVRVLRLRATRSHRLRLMQEAVADATYHYPALYSAAKAIGIRWPVLQRVAVRDAVICSELVARAYAWAGVAIGCTQPGVATPRDIEESSLFRDITAGCIRPLSPEECETVVGLIMWRNAVLGGIRTVLVYIRAIGWRLLPARRAHNTPFSEWTAWEAYGDLLQGRIKGWMNDLRWYATEFQCRRMVQNPPPPEFRSILLDIISNSLRVAEWNVTTGKHSLDTFEEWAQMPSQRHRRFMLKQEEEQLRRSIRRRDQLAYWKEKIEFAWYSSSEGAGNEGSSE